jgi:hypothetical protein
MKKIPFIRLLAFIAMIINTSAYGQCDLPVPTDSVNLCTWESTLTVTNTTSTVTFNNPPTMPAAGIYNVVLTYFDEFTGQCMPTINCSSATISVSASSFTIDLGNCASLPSDYSASAIRYTNIYSTTGGQNYFYHVRNYACSLPLGIGVVSSKYTSDVVRKKVSPVQIKSH